MKRIFNYGVDLIMMAIFLVLFIIYIIDNSFNFTGGFIIFIGYASANIVNKIKIAKLLESLK